jgi:cell division protein FtsI/penicillin-binding protein 2
LTAFALDDTCIYKAAKETWRTPIKESTSKELKKMMSRVSRYGTARKSFRYIHQSRRFSEIEYGGKTGSVDKDGIGRVDWFIGFARNPLEKEQQIAVSVVTVHGSNWTVHSAYIAAEIMRIYIRSLDPKP